MSIGRESLWFATPNLAGGFAAVIAILAIGLFLFLYHKEAIKAKIGALFCSSIALLAIYILTETYSRGGFVAFTVGIAVLLALTREKKTLWFMAVFIVFVLLTKHGVDRVESIGDFSDGSIRNRLLLWHGGLALFADNYLKGLGLSSYIGYEYTAWLQPVTLNERYTSMLNDFLTLACAYGIAGVFIICLILFLLLFWGIRVQRATRSTLMATALSAILVWISASMFSVMFMDTTMLIVFIFTVMVLITTGITYMYRHKLKLRWNYLWLPLIAAAIISLLFLGICQYVRSTFQYHWRHFPITYGAETVRVTIANPEIYDSTIVAVCESTAKDCLFIKDYLRPFMEYNCRILLFSEADKFPKEELIKYAVTQSKDTKLFFLLANKQSAILFPVIANLAPASDGLIICDIPTHALSGAPVSPEEYADQLRCKTLFINHGFNTNSTLQKVIISNNIPCEMLDLPEEKPFTESIPAIISFLK